MLLDLIPLIDFFTIYPFDKSYLMIYERRMVMIWEVEVSVRWIVVNEFNLERTNYNFFEFVIKK
jgi:hypothetical protein